MVPRAGPLVLLHDPNWPTFTGQVTKVGAGSVGNAKRESTTWVRETKPTSPCRTCRTCWKIWKIWKNTGTLMCFAWRLWPMGFQTEFVRENLSQNYLRTQKPTRPERNLLCNYQKCALPGQTWYLLQGFKVLPYWHLNWVIQGWYCDRLCQNIKVENAKKIWV